MNLPTYMALEPVDEPTETPPTTEASPASVGGPEPPPAAPKSPSDEATYLAELADDTLKAFETRFRGRISWTIDLPGLVTTDDASSQQQATILDLLVTAYEVRISNDYIGRRHLRNRKEQLEDEARKAATPPDVSYMEAFKEWIPEMIAALEDAMKGTKTIRLKDPKQQAQFAADSAAMAARLGLTVYELPPGESPPASVPPSEAPLESESTATRAPPPPVDADAAAGEGTGAGDSGDSPPSS